MSEDLKELYRQRAELLASIPLEKVEPLIERIVGVTVKFGGDTYAMAAPARHGDVMSRGFDLLGRNSADEGGFLTSFGRVVSREEAWAIAVTANQLNERAPTDRKGGTLYSEDVW